MEIVSVLALTLGVLIILAVPGLVWSRLLVGKAETSTQAEHQAGVSQAPRQMGG